MKPLFQIIILASIFLLITAMIFPYRDDVASGNDEEPDIIINSVIFILLACGFTIWIWIGGLLLIWRISDKWELNNQ